jgi:hypothetical protein
MIRRPLVSSLLLAAWLSPGGASAAVAVHDALHHGPTGDAASAALSALAHGHAHEAGTPGHGHAAALSARPALPPGPARERTPGTDVAVVSARAGIAPGPAIPGRGEPDRVARPPGPDLLARIPLLRI